MPEERLCPTLPGSDDLTRYAPTEEIHTKKRKSFLGGRGNDEEARKRKSLKRSLSGAIGVKRKRDRGDADEDEVERSGLRVKLHKGISTIFASSKQNSDMVILRTGRLGESEEIIAARSSDEDESGLNLAPRAGSSGLQPNRPSRGQAVMANFKGEIQMSGAATQSRHASSIALYSTRIFRPPVYRKPSSLSTTTSREPFDHDSPYRYKGDIFAGTAQPRSRKGPVYAGPRSALAAKQSNTGTGSLNAEHSSLCDFSGFLDRPKAINAYEDYQKAQKRGLSADEEKFWVHHLCRLGIILPAPRDSMHSEQDVSAFERAQAEARTKDRFSMGSVSQALATAEAQCNGENASTHSENRSRSFAYSYRASPYSGNSGTAYHETPEYQRALAMYAQPRRRVMFSDEVERIKGAPTKPLNEGNTSGDRPKSASRQAGPAINQASQHSPPRDASISVDIISGASTAARLNLSNSADSDREVDIPSRSQDVDTMSSGAHKQPPIQKSALRGSAAAFTPAVLMTATRRPASKRGFSDAPDVCSGTSQLNAAAAPFTPAHATNCVATTREAQQTPGIPAQAQIDAGIWWNREPVTTYCRETSVLPEEQQEDWLRWNDWHPFF
ncbi:hypothetical protein KC318_g5308 [Hortaea werneckii]|nr:hypothetical protein KC334_g490 [Hortaea werneckii]KAI7006817.1 hypothetical protein KC355_g7584 [Hortaea werneckii]KAI7668381.1 hypothetical protein KC318_g5308 [Hortaea werneckii]